MLRVEIEIDAVPDGPTNGADDVLARDESPGRAVQGTLFVRGSAMPVPFVGWVDLLGLLEQALRS
jgi:hypothetical protein